MLDGTVNEDVRTLLKGFIDLPEPQVKPAFVVISGLPGTGKSLVSHSLAQRIPIAILETDALRKVLFQEPTYMTSESARLFKATHLVLEELLKKGISTLLDATNLVESHRERLYNIAVRQKVKLFLVRVEAPPDIVKQRLEARKSSYSKGLVSNSMADWQVYQRMRPSSQPIRRNHYAVDTSQDFSSVLDRLERDIHRWMRAKS